MDFISTRGKVEACGFLDAFLMGLGNDGGLMIPSFIPVINQEELEQWQHLSYQELMFEIFKLYTNEDIPHDELKQLIHSSYSRFRAHEITPLKQINDKLYILELFHGPSFAFKDLALQFIGELYAYTAKKRGEIIHILGATSGDTGAAAIQGVKGKEGIRICILHPYQKVSKVQELQMTTVNDANVLNLAVKGNFDDCQRIIKELFADLDIKQTYHLRAVNSINFVRILAQTVYYFYAYLQLAKAGHKEKIVFSVPTGNFGNLFSGLLAQKMGLPIHKLILATNENNILERFIKEGVYQPGDFKSTYSPSMDIQIASNFERYLYYLCDQDAEQVSKLMNQLKTDGQLSFDPKWMDKARHDFEAESISNNQCLEVIKKYNNEYQYLLDPHTACGVAAFETNRSEDEVCVSFATAHPAKFNEAIALCDINQEFPDEIASLFNKSQHQEVVDNNRDDVVNKLSKFYK